LGGSTQRGQGKGSWRHGVGSIYRRGEKESRKRKKNLKGKKGVTTTEKVGGSAGLSEGLAVNWGDKRPRNNEGKKRSWGRQLGNTPLSEQ